MACINRERLASIKAIQSTIFSQFLRRAHFAIFGIAPPNESLIVPTDCYEQRTIDFPTGEGIAVRRLTGLLVLLTACFAVREANALMLTVSGKPEGAPFALSASRPLELEIELANSGASSVDLLTAQVALTVRSVAGSSDTPAIQVDPGTNSFFGEPARNISADPDVLTLQSGSILPFSLDPGERAVLAHVRIETSDSTDGLFELVALEMSIGNPQLSSQWLAPGLPPTARAFTNTEFATGGGFLLGAVRTVPEPIGSTMVWAVTSVLAFRPSGIRRRAAHL